MDADRIKNHQPQRAQRKPNLQKQHGWLEIAGRFFEAEQE
jgi:hypothetical protein